MFCSVVGGRGVMSARLKITVKYAEMYGEHMQYSQHVHLLLYVSELHTQTGSDISIQHR